MYIIYFLNGEQFDRKVVSKKVDTIIIIIIIIIII